MGLTFLQFLFVKFGSNNSKKVEKQMLIYLRLKVALYKLITYIIIVSFHPKLQREYEYIHIFSLGNESCITKNQSMNTLIKHKFNLHVMSNFPLYSK